MSNRIARTLLARRRSSTANETPPAESTTLHAQKRSDEEGEVRQTIVKRSKKTFLKIMRLSVVEALDEGVFDGCRIHIVGFANDSPAFDKLRRLVRGLAQSCFLLCRML